MKGWQKSTFIDFRGKISSTFFYGGCNLRCPYCHNIDLVLNPEKLPFIDDDDAISYLAEKKNIYEGVCLSGGEPLINKQIRDVILKIKKEGFLVKLDTNGTNVKLLQEMLDDNLIDYVALDIKTGFSLYHKVFFCEKKNDRLLNNIIETVSYLKEQNKVDYEFRSTLYPPYFSPEVLPEIAEIVSGAKRYYLQQFNSKNTIVDTGDIVPFSQKKIKELKKFFKPLVGRCNVR